MSGILLTPASQKPEQNLDRPRQQPASDQSSEGFDVVSAREKRRLEDRATESRRADQRAQDDRIADQRVADKRAARNEQQDAIADKRADASAQAESDAKAPDDARPAKESRQPEDSSRQESADATADTEAEKGAAESAKADDKPVAEAEQKESETPDDETVVPLFVANPTQVTMNQTGKAASGATAGSAAMAPVTGNGAQQSPVDVALKAGSGGGEGLSSESGESLKNLLGKSSGNGEGKGLEFSAQLNRLQGGADAASKPGNTATLQQAQGAKDVLAPLKSYSTSIDLPVQHAEWGEKVAGKLAWLTTQRMSVAEIHITPPDLGPMEVRVQVHNDQANVAIHASHAVVRDQLELNGQRLRDMLQDSGLTLDRFEVSADASGQGQRDTAGEGTGAGGQGIAGTGDATGLDQDDGTLRSGSLDLSWRGEVDLYA